MSRQWKRIVRVTLSGKGGSLSVENLKLEFSVKKSLGSKQNEATISIWNLTPSHRAQLGEEFDKIELEAGYEEAGASIIFKGNIREAKHTLEGGGGGADVKSEIECGDGDKGVNKGAISKTFPKGTKPKKMIEALVKEMPDVELGEMKGIDDLPASKRPTSLFGWSFRRLDDLGRAHAFYWSIQNGRFEAMKNDAHLSETIRLSKDTGLVGSVEITDKGIKCKALLNPRVAPGRVVDVQSGFLDEGSGRGKQPSDRGGGLFRVATCTFSGGNRQEEFYVDLEANRVQGGKVVK